MSSEVMFVVAVLGIALLAIWYRFRTFKNAYTFFKTKEGLKILTGIVLFVGVSIFSVAVFAQTKYFAYGEVYVGLDNTRKLSPQCKPSKNSDRLTSNGGFKANLVQSQDNRFELNAKYTHHSPCLLYTSPSPRDGLLSRMPSSA